MTRGTESPVVMIPARLGSARLPNKPLADIGGCAMIIHCYRRAVAAELGPVVVACAEREIAEVIWAEGGEALLTDPDLPSGSDRIFAALSDFDPQGKYNIVVNLQGDLPTLDPALIRRCAAILDDPAVDIGTLAAPVRDLRERHNPNVVKVVAGLTPSCTLARALYFTRAQAPWCGDEAAPLFHHIGLYAYRRRALESFVAHPPSVLEQRERLEQLRALDLGLRIGVALVDTVPLGVDTADDLARAVLEVSKNGGKIRMGEDE